MTLGGGQALHEDMPRSSLWISIFVRACLTISAVLLANVKLMFLCPEALWLPRTDTDRHILYVGSSCKEAAAAVNLVE